MKVTKPFDFFNIPERGWVETKSGTKVLDLTYLPSAKGMCLAGVLENDSIETWSLDGVYHRSRERCCLDLVIVEEVEDEPEKYYWAVAGSDPLLVISPTPSAIPPVGHGAWDLVRCRLTPV